MATWSDFVLADEKTTTAWGTVTSNNVQQHGLIIAYAAHYDPYGSSPAIKLSGVAHHIVLEITSQPYRTWFPYHQWYWYYAVYGYYPAYVWLLAYYYYGYYPWWYRHFWWWWHGYWHTTASVVIAIADASGEIKCEFLGAQRFLGAKLKVFNTNITPGNGKAIKSINFQRTDRLPVWVNRYVGKLEVLADDIVVLLGAQYGPYWNYLGLTLDPSPNVQVLLDETPQMPLYPYGAALVRVLRIKNDGNLSFTWNYAGTGVGVIRLTPNVEERTVTFPSISGQVYFELQTVEDAYGNNSYPKEFLDLCQSMKHRRDWGLFYQWKREDVQVIRDNSGREVFTGWKLVEIWSFPNDKYSEIQQIPGVHILGSDAELDARILYHELRW